MFSTRLDPKLRKAIKMLSVETEKPVSYLAEEAFMDLLKKYDKKIKK